MAQAQHEERIHENQKEKETQETGNSSFKFNAQAPEFVPRSHTQMPVSGYYYPCFQIFGGSSESADWFFVGDQDPSCLIPTPNVAQPNSSKNILTPDLQQKIVKQARTVVAENLPDDHSHQNLQKIFGIVGSVKTIRICHPQEPNSSRPKSDFIVSNKLHALVEYETSDIAEKAAEKLNDERNWRKGMRVRLFLRCSPKSVLKSRKSEFDGYLDDDEIINFESVEDSSPSHSNNAELFETNVDENWVGCKKGWAGRGRGKGRGRTQGRGLLAPPSQSSSTILCDAHTKHNTKGPRMPDGTRGFTMGRGKPMSPSSHVTSPKE
ncbi:hypothetical protein JHK85_004207 [Glycine max]|nr:hypothetical protein JHK85_004207 [Glycine max]